MARSLVVEQSRAIPVAVGEAFGGTLPAPLPTIFRRWYGPIPPIKQVLHQAGEWGTVGQTRTVKPVGGGSMHEELTSVDEPRSFGYTLTEVRGPLAAFVSRVQGEWIFTPEGTGTQVTWRWTIHARSAVAAPVLSLFGRAWKGYARRALEDLAGHLVG